MHFLELQFKKKNKTKSYQINENENEKKQLKRIGTLLFIVFLSHLPSFGWLPIRNNQYY